MKECAEYSKILINYFFCLVIILQFLQCIFGNKCCDFCSDDIMLGMLKRQRTCYDYQSLNIIDTNTRFKRS